MFLELIFTGEQLPRDVVLVSPAQQRSAICTHRCPLGPPSHSGRHSVLSRAPCATRYLLLSYLSHSQRQQRMGFPGGSGIKNPGDPGSVPGLGRSPGGGSGSPLQDSCLENPTGRGAWRAAVHGVTKEPDTTEHQHTHTSILLQFLALPFPLWYPHICSTCIYFCFANKIIYPCF